MRYWRVPSRRPPTTSAPAVSSTRSPPCAASPRPATRPSPGSGGVAPVPASKRRQRGSTFALSSPASTPARPSNPLLRPRPGREPDQAAQRSARLRPHQLPQPARQPDAADPTHRRLLADAHRPRRHPQGTRARPLGIEIVHRDHLAPLVAPSVADAALAVVEIRQEDVIADHRDLAGDV